MSNDAMNQSKVLLAIIERATIGDVVAPDDALSILATIINRLDTASDNYLQYVDDLFSIGACIWKMKSK